MIDDIIATKWSRIAEKPVRFDIHFTVEKRKNTTKLFYLFSSFLLNKYAFTFQNKIFFIVYFLLFLMYSCDVSECGEQWSKWEKSQSAQKA